MNKTQHLKSNSFLTMILLVVCLFAASLFTYKTIIDKIVANKEMTIESFKEEQFNLIWTSINSLQLQAEKEVTKISKNIENSILNLSPEQLKQLQEDMNNDIINHDLHKILNSNIQGKNLNGITNHMNGIVVMTTDGFIEDYNYYRALEKNESNVKEWQTAIINSYNKELEKDAFDKLLNRGTGIIALESYNLTKNDNHIKINEFTYDNLLHVYINEGINGLRNYQIFVPYYITDVGDIFGEPDILHGTKLDNNKLIVIQEFNLYDQISFNQDNVFNDEESKNITVRYDELLRLLYLFGISLIASVIGLIIYLCNVYNNMAYHEYECTGEEDSEDKCEEDSLLDGETQDNE